VSKTSNASANNQDASRPDLPALQRADSDAVPYVGGTACGQPRWCMVKRRRSRLESDSPTASFQQMPALVAIRLFPAGSLRRRRRETRSATGVSLWWITRLRAFSNSSRLHVPDSKRPATWRVAASLCTPRVDC